MPALPAAAAMAPTVAATDENSVSVFGGTADRTVREADVTYLAPQVVSGYSVITLAIGPNGTVGCGATGAMLNLAGPAPVISRPGLALLACTNPTSGDNLLRVFTRGY